ncbi:MAG: 30S ribosomal protein S17 [Candidatus Omnitrophota bacterium]
MSQNKGANSKKTIIGKVVSDKMEKTIVVQVEYLKEHPVYKKMVKKFNKFKAHDEENKAKTGDMVKISQTRPLSKDKRWRLLEIIK